MKKLLITILTLCLAIGACIGLTGCSVLDFFGADIQKENIQLKEDVSNLFDIAFPNGIIDKDITLNYIERTVEGEGDALQVTDNATVTINGGNFDGGSTPFGGAGNTAIWVNSPDAKVIINGGNFKINGLAQDDTGHIDLIYCSQGQIEINGGYFEGADNTVWLLNCKDANYKNNTAHIIVKGGSFVNFDPSNCISEGENTNFVAEGYTVVSEVINEGKPEEYRLYTVVKG